ncbi:hypothetical protein C900_05231 [Fulvivirga imtechensis AK7]|uniref:DUF4235 domain-containing protein n=1 Tax=Fulvivirga imtechensis AK7 TaxID=1237149 RepID=L8K154_9BACT|nr:DUF4235 domain-containing protein [Fulvivirga imtechensis]ELR73182.1 hypothetical protein C900_05231 [Fulvivirga imtechensis AK7]
MEKHNTKKILSKALVYGAVMLSGYAMKKVVDFGYKKIRKEEPPQKISNNRYTMGHIITYTLLSGATAALTRLLIKNYIEDMVNKPGTVERYTASSMKSAASEVHV